MAHLFENCKFRIMNSVKGFKGWDQSYFTNRLVKSDMVLDFLSRIKLLK